MLAGGVLAPAGLVLAATPDLTAVDDHEAAAPHSIA